ncbi:PDZ domain-containing protein 8-like [Carassius auratus]|uniref:PDZ domain-containing protein 8-like n=1 Tax=Carassius auratus TaxID=7957 RepID=A0A6P6P1P9_CARAU|nr:PDZ domain-containing protein 8-like [Carassius auratus]
MTRVAGRLKLQFTRMPFTHWSFSFLEDPIIDFEVKSQFEGRPLPQLTSIIVNQLKRVYQEEAHLTNYKIRYKPFFPFQVQPPLASSCDLDISIRETLLVEGRLRVTLVECSRLFILGSYERETYVHCTLELSSDEWREKTRSSIKEVHITCPAACVSLCLVYCAAHMHKHACLICINKYTCTSRHACTLLFIGQVKSHGWVDEPVNIQLYLNCTSLL